MAKRVKPIRFTQAELLLVHRALSLGPWNTPRHQESTQANIKVQSQCLAKLEDAVADDADETPKVAAGPMEATMMAHSKGKLAKMVTGAAYARASLLLTKLGAGEQDMVDLGQWLSRQGWITGTVTLVTVLGKWDEWLPRARAEKVNRAPQGFGDDGGFQDIGQGPTGQRSADKAGRRPSL